MGKAEGGEKKGAAQPVLADDDGSESVAGKQLLSMQALLSPGLFFWGGAIKLGSLGFIPGLGTASKEQLLSPPT